MAKVMIVDDDRVTIKLLQTLLELDGFEVATAPRGMDVMPLAAKEKPDLFLMDYHLADMDGVEIVRDLRGSDEFAKTPIIVTSGLNVEQEALAAGANLFLVKPFEPEELQGVINGLLKG